MLLFILHLVIVIKFVTCASYDRPLIDGSKFAFVRDPYLNTVRIQEDVSLQEDLSVRWPNGIVRYYVDAESYERAHFQDGPIVIVLGSDDDILGKFKELFKFYRHTCSEFGFCKNNGDFYFSLESDDNFDVHLKTAIRIIQRSSCIKFMRINEKPSDNMTFIHITNPEKGRECNHEPSFMDSGEIILVFGYDCLKTNQLLHTLLHGIGVKDEVTHPHRDRYIRVLWDNIHPAYQHLYRKQDEMPSKTLVEYDPLSVMHFHDRAFSRNGRATVTPLESGLLISPSETLSQLDKMRLHIYFGHECNKRKVSDLLQTCKKTLKGEIDENLDKEAKIDGDGGNDDENVDDRNFKTANDLEDFGGIEAEKKVADQNLALIDSEENKRKEDAQDKEEKRETGSEEADKNKTEQDETQKEDIKQNKDISEQEKHKNLESNEEEKDTEDNSKESTGTKKSAEQVNKGDQDTPQDMNTAIENSGENELNSGEKNVTESASNNKNETENGDKLHLFGNIAGAYEESPESDVEPNIRKNLVY